jgi:5-methylcytosine-specific restriction protein A
MAKRPPSFRSGSTVSTPRKWAATSRGSASERGYGYAWQKLRAAVLKRDTGLCQHCIKQGRSVVAKDVDHIVPKHRGGTDDHANLQSLCVECHKVKTAHEGQKAQR